MSIVLHIFRGILAAIFLLNPFTVILMIFSYFSFCLTLFLYGIAAELFVRLKLLRTLSLRGSPLSSRAESDFTLTRIFESNSAKLSKTVKFKSSGGPESSVASSKVANTPPFPVSLPSSASLPTNLSDNMSERTKLMLKPFLVPLVTTYLAGRITCFATLNLIEFSIVQFSKTVPLLIKGLQVLFRAFVRQLKHIRFLLLLIYTYIISPLFSLLSPPLEFAIHHLLKLALLLHQYHLVYTPKIKNRVREIWAKVSVYLFQFYSKRILPLLLQAWDFGALVIPLFLTNFYKLIAAAERLHASLRPHLEPYIIFVLLQIQLVLVISSRLFLFVCSSILNVLTSPYIIAYTIIQWIWPIVSWSRNLVVQSLDRLALTAYNALLLGSSLAAAALHVFISIVQTSRKSFVYYYKAAAAAATDFVERWELKRLFRDLKEEAKSVFIKLTNTLNNLNIFAQNLLLLANVRLQQIIDWLNNDDAELSKKPDLATSASSSIDTIPGSTITTHADL